MEARFHLPYSSRSDTHRLDFAMTGKQCTTSHLNPIAKESRSGAWDSSCRAAAELWLPGSPLVSANRCAESLASVLAESELRPSNEAQTSGPRRIYASVEFGDDFSYRASSLPREASL